MGSFLGLMVPSCLQPTQVTLELSTDARCEDLDETQLFIGLIDEPGGLAPSAITKACSEDGTIGTIVFVPKEDRNQQFAFSVVVGVGKETDACPGSGFQGGCIVARRVLSFVPHQPLVLPVELEVECLDVPCGATETCRSGSCVPALINDPENCTDPLGCDGSADGSGGSSSGGSAETGGEDASGGIEATGGTEITGGAEGTGGDEASGGDEATGGMMSSGGVSSGGSDGSGGMTPDPLLHLIQVTTTSDVADGDVRNLDTLVADPGEDAVISLREAILAANQTANDNSADVIEFAIPGPGPHSILVQAPGLPAIDDAVVIDAFTQNPSAHAIEIVGTMAGNVNGLRLAAGSSGSTLLGLVINRFVLAGIRADDSGTHTILGNWLGVGMDGLVSLANSDGLVLSQSPENLVGGSLLGGETQINIFSGNTNHGLALTGLATSGNRVQGNLVGLNRSGTGALGNRYGIGIFAGARENLIGGSGSSVRNIISGNQRNGIRMTDAKDNVVSTNFIGSDVAFSAVSVLGNGWAGIAIAGNSSGNRVGSLSAGDANRIAFNQDQGILIETAFPQRNANLGNWFFENIGLGIDLGPSLGVSPNDAGDADSGANGLLNYPVPTSASYSAGSVTVGFNLDVPAGNYRIEFGATSQAHASGFGQGQGLTHAVNVSHAGQGIQAYVASFSIAQSSMITATCTEIIDAQTFGNSSEFSFTFPTTYSP
jgi:hypothetical protein